MSTLEKAVISLMESMPENKIETIYAFIRFLDSEKDQAKPGNSLPNPDDIQSLIGIGHEYADQALTEHEEG